MAPPHSRAPCAPQILELPLLLAIFCFSASTMGLAGHDIHFLNGLKDKATINNLVRIEDNGAGITEDQLPYLFDRFFQGSRRPDRAEGGLGLGLALVKSLVTLHGGSVTAASEGAGRGSVFEVRLPIASGDAPSSMPVSERMSAPTASSMRGDACFSPSTTE